MPQLSDGRRAYPGGARGAGGAGGGDQPVGGPAWQEISSRNLNLQLRVAELEALLGGEAAQASGGGGGGGGGSGGGSVSHPGPAATRPNAHGEAQARLLEREWAAVERMREEVATLRNDLELGKLPGEPQERRKGFKRKMTDLQEKVLILEAEALALRQNNREALRRRDDAAGDAEVVRGELAASERDRAHLQAQIRAGASGGWEAALLGGGAEGSVSAHQLNSVVGALEQQMQEQAEMGRAALRGALAEAERRAVEAEKALGVERRQHAFVGKRVVRLDAEARTSKEQAASATKQIDLLRGALSARAPALPS
ncbi:hypothetical protein T484DRAFT_1884965, partial [Baffinella frigidus]